MRKMETRQVKAEKKSEMISNKEEGENRLSDLQRSLPKEESIGLARSLPRAADNATSPPFPLSPPESWKILEDS